MNFKALIPQFGARGLPGAQIINGSAAPEAEEGNDGDFFVRYGPEGDTQIYGPKVDGAWGAGRSIRGGQGLPGLRGWNPVLLPELVSVEIEEGVFQERMPVRLAAWIGGQGTSPTTFVGHYVNAAGDGFTEDLTEALDLRGAPGIDGVMSGMETIFAETATIGALHKGRNIVIASEDPVTLTLDEAEILGEGWMAMFLNQGSAAATIATSGDEEINGQADLTIAAGLFCMIWVDGSGEGFRATPPVRSLDQLFGGELDLDGAKRAAGRAAIGSDGNLIQVQRFTSSGTYTPHPDMRFCIMECQGAGGGGGPIQGEGSVVQGGTGGGAGEYAQKLATAEEVGASQTVTIGAGGAGGVAATPTDGTDGGDTSVGSLCVAKGGKKGMYVSGSQAAGGEGGGVSSPGTGDLLIAGESGMPNVVASIMTVRPLPGGQGGRSRFGRPGPLRNMDDTNHARTGSGYGAGGNGATVRNSASNLNGAAGLQGLVQIWEFR